MSSIPYTQTNVGIPLFAAEFDPYARGYLVVAGGGGENRSGVANKLSLLNTNSLKHLSVTAEIDLSRLEDSPQSVASLATKEGLFTFAGINGSSASQEAGKNEHFRTFSLDFSAAQIKQISKSALFNHARGSANKSYQRLLRLSRVQKRDTANKRIGVIATAMAETNNELVIFDATTPSPGRESICAHITLQKGEEVADVDLWEPNSASFNCIYCTDHDVFFYGLAYDFASNTSKPQSFSPSLVYSCPQKPGKQRPQMRSIRWLSSHHALVLENIPGDGGASLLILRLHGSSMRAEVTLIKALPKKLARATGLDVALLDPDPATGEQQIVVAVLSKDGSVPMYTLNYTPSSSSSDAQLSAFRDYHTIPALHKTAVTQICLSNFFAPRQPATSNQSVASKTMYIQLASVALGGTVAVCNVPLTSTPTSPSNTTATDDNTRKSPNVRWVLSDPKSERFTSLAGRIVLALLVLLFAIALQGYMRLPTDQRNEITSSFKSVLASLKPPGGRDPPIAVHSKYSSVIGKANSGIGTISASFASTLDDTAGSAAHWTSSASTAASSVAAHVHNRGILDLLHLHHSRHFPSPPAMTDKVGMDRVNLDTDSSQHETNPELVKSQQPHTNIVMHALNIMHDPETGELAASTHPEVDVGALKARGARKFEELSESEQERWKSRLTEAGHWAENLPVTILKGVLFSEYAGVVGGALRDAVLQG